MSAKEKPKGVLDGLKTLGQRGQALAAPEIKAMLLPLDAIAPDPAQPRTTFHSLDAEVVPEEREALEELAANIAQHGLLQPITVRRINEGRYEIIAGERRWRAFKLNQSRGVAGAERIPAFIVEKTDATELRLLQLAENQQRRDLTDIDVATFLKKLLEEKPELQKQDLAKLMNKKSQYISRIMAVLDPRWKHVVDTGIITYASVLELFRSLSEESQNKLVEVATQEQRPLTVTDIRQERAAEIARAAATEAPAPAASLPPAGAGGISRELAESVQNFIDEQSPKNETYQPGVMTEDPRIVDHGGDAVIPQDAGVLNRAVFEKRQVTLTLEQIAKLLENNALPNMGHSVKVELPVEDLRAAIAALGGDVPQDDHQLDLELHKRINSL